MKEQLTHLLIKGEFRVWCRPNNPIGDYKITMLPSKANCANCLTVWRRETQGNRKDFRVSWTKREIRRAPSV